MNPITVLLAEDHTIVREGLRALLTLEDDVKVVGEAENGHQAVALASKLCPDVVIMDIAMPLLNGLGATRRIIATTPSTKVLVLSAHGDGAYVKEAMAVGASGYLIKQAAARLLPKAIRKVHNGESFLDLDTNHTPETAMNPITVLLAEDHTIVREGLRALLKLEADFKIVGEAENGRQAVALASKLCPDVVVMDIAMPLLNGLEATRQILQSTPSTKVLVLSAHSDDAYVEQVMALGASGYLIKQTAAHVLPDAIREIHKGKAFFSPAISKRRTDHEKKARARGDLPGKTSTTLTSREMEVLQLVAEGKANKETADELHISVKTVEKHRQSLMEKLNIHDTAGLTRYAISAGIIESSVQLTIL